MSTDLIHFEATLTADHFFGYDMERLIRDIRVLPIGGVTTEVMQDIISKYIHYSTFDILFFRVSLLIRLDARGQRRR